MQDEVRQQVVERIANTVTYSTAGGATILGLTANELAALGGFIVAVLVALANVGIHWYYRHRTFRELMSRDCDMAAECPALFERRKRQRRVNVDRRLREHPYCEGDDAGQG